MKTLILSFLLIVSSCGNNSSGGKSSSESQASETSTNQDTNQNPLKNVVLTTPDGHEIDTSLAYKSADQQQGLSGVKPENFNNQMGKLFMYFKDSARVFWMPNTYFALDIVYLNQDLTINEIVWALPAYSGNVNSEIPRAPSITSRHVLEMKAGSPISASLREGDKLGWKSSLPLTETLKKMDADLN
jgi:uncharacterized membrane protein (UPF0127 family)